MGTVAIYMGMIVLGYLVGFGARKKNIKIKGVFAAQMTAVVILLTMMGARIGADEEVMASLGTIGISSVVLTVFAFAGSILAVTLFRKMFGINKEGVRKND